MARPCLEVFVAKLHGACRTDSTILNPVLETVGAAEGCLGIYHGVAIEDSSLLLIFVVWATREDGLALAHEKTRFEKIAEHFAACGDPDRIVTLQTVLDADLAPILHAPYVSFDHVLSTRPGKTSEDVLRAAEDIHWVIAPAEGCTGGVSGKAVDKDEWMVVYGWEDPKHHAQAARQEHVKPVGKVWHEIVHVVIALNVPLTTYKKYEA
ncbi:hypothetical protein PsYK624_155970 [Phanerochaete sordida]|uniref:ABM domain-containing protein n=1 Tax=Phanerochaete sordida TaxID=48140 RepID=A0A9P3LL57_9APHY|nr:hypothetical protein PsYK624_155970 [Phanerochaete sordida]